MAYFIAIDSAKQLKFSGVISGSYKEIFEFYADMEKIFVKRGIRSPFHYHKLTNKQKGLCRNDIVSLVNNSLKIKINIFQHRIPQRYSHKDYYLFHIPNCISEDLESWIKSQKKDCDIEVKVNEDYNIRHQKHGTNIFIENLIRQIGLRATGKVIAVLKNTREDQKMRATIKLLNGCIIDFYASKTQINESKEIQSVDIVLGYYIDNKYDFDPKRIHFREI
ncbi:hypothetical protein HYZ41_00290 [archaeon]|nr:hypothetical protein [archaeon]